MKVKVVFFVVVFVALIAFFGYLMGSNWFFVTPKTLPIYSRDDSPLNEMTLISSMPRGGVVKVEKCFFDKDDAYLFVSVKAGITGYVFETKQRYFNKWQMHSVSFSKHAFVNQLDCWRLIGQFGLF